MLHRITYLRSLSNLTVFTFEGNPAADQLLVNTYNSCSSDDGSVVKNAIEKFDSKSIYRIFVIFHLCSLVLLDNKEILPFERQVAEQRYSQVEVSRYLKKLDRYENRLNEVETKKSLLEKDLFDQQSRLDETLRERNVENKLITELEEELRAKDKLLHSKSEELARACLKHFELEQELAFHKIDEKLGLCGLCLPESTNSPYIHQVQDTGDEPYLGKCMFRRKPVSKLSTSHLVNEDSSGDFKNSTKDYRYSLDQIVPYKKHANNKCNTMYMPKGSVDSNEPVNGNGTVLPTTHCVSPDAMKQVHGNELEYKEVNHGQLTRPNSAPEGSRISSPSVNELHLDKLQEFSISEKSISHEKFPEVSMKETNKSSQTTDKQLCEFSKHSDIKQVQLLLSKLQSELAQLRIRESKILKDDNGNNNNPIYPSKTDNLNKMQLNNHIQMLDDELSKIWTVTSLLKSGSGCGNSVTNVCLNSFATLLKTSSAQSKHASAQSPKCRFHGGLLKHSLPHHQRERSFSLPSEDFDARQIISSNNLIHCNGTTSAGSEFDSCEEFLDISRGLNHSKKKPNRQCRLSHTQRSVTPSTPSSRTTGTGRSTLLSILTPRTNDAYTINDLRKPLPTASEWNLDDHANHNPYNEIHESSSNCIPYESSTPVHVHYVKAKTTNVLNCPRGTGVGGALPTPPFPQPSFESFQSNSLTGNTNEDIIGRDFIQPTKSNSK
ncbi:unnamed protein product [Heterobilharzia americana]|nr:unnamed protein product [Heterobilharzia americana]